MKRISRILCLVLVAVLLFSVAACTSPAAPATPSAAPAASNAPASQAPEATGDAPAEQQTFKIGWSLHNLTPYNIGMDEYVNDFFAKNFPGTVEVIMSDAQSDAMKQVADIEDMIAQDVDCIFVKSHDESSISNVLGTARDQGILVVLLQRMVKTENYDFFVGCNYDTLGTDMGNEVLKAFPDGNFNYVFVEGNPGSSTDIETVEKVEKVFADSGLPGIVKLDGQFVKVISRAESKTIMEDWITAHGETIDVVLCTNDELLIGTVQALDECSFSEEKKKSIFMAGVNVVTELLPRIQDGTVNLSFISTPGMFPCMELNMEHLTGNGAQYQRNYEIPSFPVTPNNVDLYYEDTVKAGLYMLGFLPPAKNPLFDNLDQLYPELVPLITKYDWSK